MAFTSVLGTSDSALVGSTMTAGEPLVDPLNQSVSHALNLQSFTGAQGIVSSTIVWTADVDFELLIDDFEAVSSNLGLSQSVEVSGTVQFLEQNLNLIQTVDVTTFGPLVQNLNLIQNVYYAGPVAVSVESEINLTQLAGRAKEEIIVQNLGLTHFAADVQKSELNLTQGVMAYLNASPHFEQDLGLSHTVQASSIYTANLAHTDIVSQAVTFWVDDGTSCPRNDYFGDQGTLGDEPFTAQTGAQMTLASLDGTDDIVLLRNPELDDRDRIGYTRVNRESRGGELQVYRDPSWPLVNTLQATVVGLKRTDVDDLLSFLEDHLGEEISLNDWHGRYWRGVITNPDEPVVEDTKDRWTMSFEFEGVEMPGPDVLQSVGLSHVLNVIQELTRDMSSPLGLTHTVVVVTDDVQHNGDNVQYNQFGINEVTYSG